MKLKEILRDFIFLLIFITIVLLSSNFISENSVAIVIALSFFVLNYGIIVTHEKRYKKNFPYKPSKRKNKISERVLTGLVAGLHYTFYIWTYDHKKYNTQVDYPETLECYIGNISQLIVLIGYIFISAKLFQVLSYYSLFFMIIPILTNLISYLFAKHLD